MSVESYEDHKSDLCTGSLDYAVDMGSTINDWKNMSLLKKVFWGVVLLVFVIGMVYAAVFFATMRYGWMG